jgi:hypothetical protein
MRAESDAPPDPKLMATMGALIAEMTQARRRQRDRHRS